MKKFFIFLIALILGFIAWQLYKKRSICNPGHAFSYRLNDSVDANYHSQELVNFYFRSALDLEQMAKKGWLLYGEDIRNSASDAEEIINLRENYFTLQSRVLSTEKILVQSALWKKEGVDNAGVISLELNGGTPRLLRIRNKLTAGPFKKGDKNELVWEVQKALEKKGFSLRIDGELLIETEQALIQYQTQEGIYPSGMVDENTVQKLLF